MSDINLDEPYKYERTGWSVEGESRFNRVNW